MPKLSLFSPTEVVNTTSCIAIFSVLTSQQNGITERKHHHIVETGLALLTHSSLPLRYWDAAFLTTCYLINRMPTPVFEKDTPVHRLFRVQPNYDSLRTFGCLVFASIML
jgi:histone deacetylase 1/2